MTQQRTDGAPTADPAGAYLEALRGRLASDGCEVTASVWRDCPVVIGSRSDRRARWFGTKMELFVFAAAAPAVDEASMAQFTGWAMDYAKSIRSGLAGARNAAIATERASFGSFFSDRPEPSSRTRDANMAGMSTTCSPAARSCCANR